MGAEESSKKPTVAYVPFKTFLTAIESLEQIIPTTIDRTVWDSASGAIQSQLLGAFRFLGLIKEDGTPTPDLERLVHDKANRKGLLRKLLERSYPELVKRDLTKMSAGTFEAAMREYGLQGETNRKASSFFLQAARYADLPLSSLILKTSRSMSTGRRRRTVKPDIGTENNGEAPHVAPPSATGPVKTIQLENEITLSLSSSADIFQMAPQDRQFVMKLLDQIEQHVAKAKVQGAPLNEFQGRTGREEG